MSKETILKEFIQELLDDVILGKSENESVSVFRKNISIKVNDFYSKISSQTREETIREIEKKIVKYIDENKKKNFNNRELIGYEILDLIN